MIAGYAKVMEKIIALYALMKKLKRESVHFVITKESLCALFVMELGI
tara:strand:- start:285 stop:425 length:141 start_codon:yes stop_codon:yes gene_type:complete